MSEAAVLGLPSTFTFEGVDYPFGERTLAVEAEFTSWLEARGYLMLQRHRRLLGNDYPARLDAWQRDCTAGVYAWGERPCVQALYSEEGLRRMALLRLQYGESLAAQAGRHCTGRVSPELVDRVWADPVKRDELAALALDLKAEGPGPNGLPAAPPG